MLILSAKHGLAPLRQVIDPYDDSLTTATMLERRHRAARVMARLRAK